MADSGKITIQRGTEPASPSTGYTSIFVDSADGHVKRKSDAGVVVDLESGLTPSPGDYTASEIDFVPAGDIVATEVQAAIEELDAEKAPIGHVGSGGVSEHAIATGAAAGFLSPSDFTKLASVASGATANDTDANLKNRANHTGTQLAGTISDFATAADARAAITSAPIAHVGSGGSAHAQVVAGVSDGFMLAADKTKLDGIAVGATANDTDANLRNRATHTGTQLHTTISDFNSGARSAVVDDAIVDGVVNKAPSQNAVFDALVAKLSDPMTTDGDLITRAAGVAARLGIGAENQILRVLSGAVAWDDENIGQDFGDGNLGNLTLSGSLVLAGKSYYDTLTLVAGAALTTNGFPLYCKVLDLSNAPVGAIRWNGNNGVNSATQSGGSGGSALTATILGGSSAGTQGGSGVVGAGVQATAASNLSPANGGSSGAGGGSGSGVNGGITGRSAATVSNRVLYGRLETAFLRATLQIVGGCGGPGGSSGGGDGVSATNSCGGGGGGSGAGMVAIYADKIITSVSTPAGVIQAIGGNGGNGRTAPNAGAGGGGGGAGGGGGYIFLAYNTKEGPVVSSLIQAHGGNGGNGGNSVTGTGGAGGGGGNAGYIDAIDFSLLSGIHIGGAAGTAGTLQSGTTGGSGGVGGLANLSI
jgi:hypothetical protein